MGDSKVELQEPAPFHSWVWEVLLSRSLVSTHYTALAFLLAVCIPSAPRKSILRYGLLLLQITCALQAFVAPPPPTSDSAVLYTTGVLMANLLARYLDRLYTNVPEESFHRISSTNQSEEDATRLPLTQRLPWALELFSVTRGIGWDWRVSRIPELTAPKSRARFVTARLLTIIAMYAGLYLLEVTCQELLASYPSPGIDDGNPIQILMGDLFLYGLIVLGLALVIYSHFALFVLPLSILCVGLQTGPVAWRDMSAWPPDYGSFNANFETATCSADQTVFARADNIRRIGLDSYVWIVPRVARNGEAIIVWWRGEIFHLAGSVHHDRGLRVLDAGDR
ncbi:hypothetical protein An10g00160 [Aspergillus niger]|uniref:Uncharacterized protein n=2 Tax=Aspergillus niger TaxID=5061 RepID=A2QUW8_ASPNC|nr:hypothetical protein An10g00160 [Aspergillus niger]CAK49107.1 hypothetical protein An10g00160 [Aspergillus niger]